jgi:hypothetical protein
MKKVYESTEAIKKMELEKLKNREDKKIEKFGVYSSQMQKQKQNLEEKRTKEKKKFEHVLENYEEINNGFQNQKLELSAKIKSKKQSRIKELMNGRMNEYINKRQSSYDRFIENYSSIKKFNNRRNLTLKRIQHIKHKRSYEKARSMEISKENIRFGIFQKNYFILFFTF